MSTASANFPNKGSSDPPQLPSHRTRKRPRDKLSSAAVDYTFREQVSIIISVQDQAVAQSSLTKSDVIPDKKVDDSTVNDTVKKQREATVTHPISDSQLELCPARDDSMSRKDKEEDKMTENCDQTLSRACTDQHKVFPLTSEEAGQSCSAALEDQQRTTKDFQCDLIRNQKASQGGPINESMDDSKDDKAEAVAGEPAKKRKRMGMCGLTEKERSHFLQISKNVNSRQKAEEQMSTNGVDIKSSLLTPSLLPTPAAIIAEYSEEKILHSSHDSAADRQRPVTEVHIPDAPSDGCDSVRTPSLYDKSHAHEDVITPDPTIDTKSDPAAMENEYHLENPNPKEVDCGSPSITSSNVEVQCVARTTNEKMHDRCGDVVDCVEVKADASSANNQQGDYSVKLCEAAPSGGLETNGMPGHDDDPNSGAVSTEHPQTMKPAGFLGSGCFDFVTDSQLNNIELIEDEAIKEKVVQQSEGREEDASALMCGLIKELSFLNRSVMAAHREIENIRRGSKNLRSLLR
ncbi:uncharacterized protein LOC144020182 [Festucalex cinctus]